MSTSITPSPEPGVAAPAQPDALIAWLKGFVLVGIGGLALAVITTWLAGDPLSLAAWANAANPLETALRTSPAIALFGFLLIRTMGVGTRKAAVALACWVAGLLLAWALGLIAANAPMLVLLAFWLLLGAVCGASFALLPALNGGKQADRAVAQAAVWLLVYALFGALSLVVPAVAHALLLLWCAVAAVQLTLLARRAVVVPPAEPVMSVAPEPPAAVVPTTPVPRPSVAARLPSAAVSRLLNRFPDATVQLLQGDVSDVQALIRSTLSKEVAAEIRDFALRALLEHTLRTWWRGNRTTALTAQDLDDLRSFVQLAVSLALDGDSETGLGDPPNAAVFRSVLIALLDDWVAYKVEEHA